MNDDTKLPPQINIPPVVNQKVITATDLILQCNEAASKMSASNPNRVLMMNCGYAIRQLVDRLAFHEKEEQ